MRKAFKYRLYPTLAQANALAAILESHRALYNAALQHRRWAWEDGVAVSYGDQSAELKDIRREDDGLARCNFSSCQATLRRLDRAFRAFFRRVRAGEHPGYPRFKGRDRFDTVEFPAHGDGCRFTGERVSFQGVGTVKVKYHRPVDGTIKTVAFKHEAEKWFVVVSCNLGDAPPLVTDKRAVGIDLGLTAFLVTSDGETVASPRFAKREQAKLRRAQRALARCQRGRKRRRKAKARVARSHAKVVNQRRDFHHKTAVALALRDRVYHCASCGLTLDRDLNAARNVLRRGRRRQAPTEALASVA